MSKVYSVLVLSVLVLVIEFVKGDVSEIFDVINIEVPQGPLFPGDKVKFSCISKKLPDEGLDWAFQVNGTIYEAIHVDPKNDIVEYLENNSLKRTSYITINPKVNITGISCKHKNGEFKKTVNVPVYNHLRIAEFDGGYPNVTYPRLILIRYDGVSLFVSGNDILNLRTFFIQHDVTNESIDLYPNVRGFRLFCVHRNESDYNWKFSSANPSKPDATDLLNNIALINRLAMASNRFPSECNNKGWLDLEDLRIEILDVTIPPLKSNRTTTYFCESKFNKAQIKVNAISQVGRVESTSSVRTGTTVVNRTSHQDQELLQLINLVMQILQGSNDSSGSNHGPLYGVGFGSTTTIVLLFLKIYHLRKQLKKMEDRVSQCEYPNRRRPTRPIEDEDEDL